MLRTAVLLAVAAVLLAVVMAGAAFGIWLDQRYLETRFDLPRRACPLAMYRDGSIITPVCSVAFGCCTHEARWGS